MKTLSNRFSLISILMVASVLLIMTAFPPGVFASTISDYPNSGWIWEDSTTVQVGAIASTTGFELVAVNTAQSFSYLPSTATTTTAAAFSTYSPKQANWYFGCGIVDWNTTNFTGTSRYLVQFVDASTYADATNGNNYPGNIIDSFTLSSAEISAYFNAGTELRINLVRDTSANYSVQSTSITVLNPPPGKYYRAWSPFGRGRLLKEGVWALVQQGYLSPKFELHVR